MKQPTTFDFWYAVKNTEILVLPSRHLETFGTTILNYHLVTELMDSVNQIRIRQGRMQALRPQIITPEAYSKTLLEGFGEEASKYVEWLREHEKEIRVILQYGYQLKQEKFSEHVVSDNIQAVTERVRNDVKASNDPFSAVLVGVETPWDVCLVKLFHEIVQKSAALNVMDLNKRHMLDDMDGTPKWIRNEVEEAFAVANHDSNLIGALSQTLQKYGLFEEYQDRFFGLIKRSRN